MRERETGRRGDLDNQSRCGNCVLNVVLDVSDTEWESDRQSAQGFGGRAPILGNNAGTGYNTYIMWTNDCCSIWNAELVINTNGFATLLVSPTATYLLIIRV